MKVINSIIIKIDALHVTVLRLGSILLTIVMDKKFL